ncbi:MAG: 16S rRNA (guanine(527)-N(7))-methyltransferase RsmG, partial [Pseudomonadota bacterium]|nr:16S rRNA (guanine(527)-N(7))-methyltransferase RsmG [Pseudomonadota bacterium]
MTDNGRALFARSVSRETLSLCDSYVALLLQWNRRINLIGQTTESQIWERHMRDSAQLRPLIPDSAEILVDLGSGAGLPGLVLALLWPGQVHLIDSSTRKGAFLREAVYRLGVADRVIVHSERCEQVPPLRADVVTARALAPLPKLLPLMARHGKEGTIFLCLKGRQANEEITAARKGWTFGIKKT